MPPRAGPAPSSARLRRAGASQLCPEGGRVVPVLQVDGLVRDAVVHEGLGVWRMRQFNRTSPFAVQLPQRLACSRRSTGPSFSVKHGRRLGRRASARSRNDRKKASPPARRRSTARRPRGTRTSSQLEADLLLFTRADAQSKASTQIGEAHSGDELAVRGPRLRPGWCWRSSRSAEI
jgi:hypothetical protein